MKTTLRLLLPPLRAITADTVLRFALLDRDLRILRSGELAVHELAQAVQARHVQAFLDADDTVHVRVTVPPLSGARREAAIINIVEPLTLSAPEQLALACSPREADGQATLVWTEREPLARTWQLLMQSGLGQVQFYPLALLVPQDAATEPCSPEFWQRQAPAWSLNPPALRPAPDRASHWRAPLAWTAAATAVWLLGLNVHAARVADESTRLRQGMQQQVAQAFPELPVVLDPVKQATQRRDALRASQGAATTSDFVTLALAAAELLPDMGKHLQGLDFQDGVLRLVLQDDDGTKSLPDAAPIERAKAQDLRLSRTDTGWRIERLGAQDAARDTRSAGPARLNIRQQGLPR